MRRRPGPCLPAIFPRSSCGWPAAEDRGPEHPRATSAARYGGARRCGLACSHGWRATALSARAQRRRAAVSSWRRKFRGEMQQEQPPVRRPNVAPSIMEHLPCHGERKGFASQPQNAIVPGKNSSIAPARDDRNPGQCPCPHPVSLPLRRPFLEKLDTRGESGWLASRRPDRATIRRAAIISVATFDVDLGDIVGYEIAIHRFEMARAQDDDRGLPADEAGSFPRYRRKPRPLYLRDCQPESCAAHHRVRTRPREFCAPVAQHRA